MLTLTIDGKPVTAEPGQTVLQAARQAGIFIPTLCDHPALRPSGGCRLCVVQVEGARGPQTACTLPVSAGMVVQTDTPALRENREFVLSMLFSENNHLCPFCAVSGGDCELQNNAYQLGMTHWPFQPAWAPREVDATAPDFIFDPNRCILCRRCLRACGELVGSFTLGVAERGAQTRLIADGDVPLGDSTCVGCGTCVQVCPTGALFGRRDAYQGRRAQSQATDSICVGCSVGCGIRVITRDGRLVRIEGNWDAPVNSGLLCRYGRFEPLKEARDRVLTPLVRRNGALQPATWEEALAAAANGLPGAAGYISPRLPVEALAAFRQLLGEGLHSPLPAMPSNHAAPEAGLTALHAADLVILLGADLVRHHQVAGFFVKRRLPQGLQLAIIDADETALDARADFRLRPAAGAEAATLQSLLAAAGQPAAVQALAAALAAAQQPVLVFGAQPPEVTALLPALIGRYRQLRVLDLHGAANSRAARSLGLVHPFQPAAGQPVLVDLGDAEPPADLLAAVQAAPFVVVQASYASPLTERADVVLPVEIWTEQTGHYLNLEGRLQTAQAALAAPAGVRSNVAVLEGLAQALGVALTPEWRAALRLEPVAVSLN